MDVKSVMCCFWVIVWKFLCFFYEFGCGCFEIWFLSVIMWGMLFNVLWKFIFVYVFDNGLVL